MYSLHTTDPLLTKAQPRAIIGTRLSVPRARVIGGEITVSRTVVSSSDGKTRTVTSTRTNAYR
jgi:hypothetical protein